MPFILTDWKAIFRKQATQQRKIAYKDQPSAPARAASVFMHDIAPPQDKVIALYCPFGSELDTWPLAERLGRAGNRLCLPVVVDTQGALIFRHFDIDQTLTEGKYGILTPPETAAIVRPDIIVTPLLGFMRQGERLGMGGGFYDRTLAQLRGGLNPVTAIGYAYSGQEIEKFPVEAHDARLDAIVTDLECIVPF